MVARGTGRRLGARRRPDHGPRAQWVGRALDRLAEEGVPLLGEGAHRCVDMGRATRMPFPDDIVPYAPAARARASRAKVRAAEPCWKHDTVQYTCRDCTA